MPRTIWCVVGAAIVAASLLAATSQDTQPTDRDRKAIRQASLDYVEGWYTCDADRMARALHEDLAKRIAIVDSQTNESKLHEMTAEQLIAATGRRTNKTPEDAQVKRIEILDVYGNAATVKAEMRDWIDYMHIARFGDEWKIVNVLWVRKPSADD